jgi:hypothetical protein
MSSPKRRPTVACSAPIALPTRLRKKEVNDMTDQDQQQQPLGSTDAGSPSRVLKNPGRWLPPGW